ncbi:hypothetical protein [Cellulomonas composti]|uniref:Uncharacterized protein n=1 Tax=Cellulomonas composti TaxID=266130 RepID=A0A511JBL0_9CELL|nr:hypothetical protein [Cellulomonas composti]GEL95372.1 hypothetical protein CCO02nite_20300 [Cellulomonas composti]
MSETCLVHSCAIRGRHIPETQRTRPHDDCTGCDPTPADDGLTVCRWHANRYEDTLVSLLTFLPHLREIGRPYAQATPPSDSGGTSDPAHRTVLPAAWLAADEITADHTGWCKAVLEEAPARLTWPDRKPWLGDEIRWMLDHLPWALNLPFTGDMVGSFTNTVATARHQWPTADDTQPVEGLAMPCPSCGLKSLIRKPPRWEGDPWRVECTDPDCARIYDEGRYDELVEIALRQRVGKWDASGGAA